MGTGKGYKVFWGGEWGGALVSAQRKLYSERDRCSSKAARKLAHTLFLRVPRALFMVKLDRWHKSVS